jgi:hypothetical protein
LGANEIAAGVEVEVLYSRRPEAVGAVLILIKIEPLYDLISSFHRSPLLFPLAMMKKALSSL